LYFKSERLGIKERITAGKALRRQLPREELGEFKPAANRADPVFILEEQGKTRIRELVPVRYARMLTSPFAFLRGGAAIMAGDLAAGGVGSVGTRCWVVFLMGNHSGDPLFLQIKEAQPSVLEQYVEGSVYSHQGQRVVAGYEGRRRV
jgi:uncharacterized protein (DUF2252 family)